ncbi:hypothetical protein BASA81_000424 [Batrachochytrium salamandrivorans]|nr:hypothetical protein BASA81_000424 [Batrachochytrium salamandrivorans]
MNSPKDGRWTRAEHERFLDARQRYGKNWRKISLHVSTRTNIQCRTHAQSFNPHYMPVDDDREQAEELQAAAPDPVLASFRDFVQSQRAEVVALFSALAVSHQQLHQLHHQQPALQTRAKASPSKRPLANGRSALRRSD